MLSISKPATNRVDITLDGGIDANIMSAALDELIDASKDVQNGTSLYTIVDFDMPTLGALGVEITRLPSLFRLLGKYEKIAVLTDNALLRVAGEIEGILIPGLEIRGFHLNDRAEAEAWLGAQQL